MKRLLFLSFIFFSLSPAMELQQQQIDKPYLERLHSDLLKIIISRIAKSEAPVSEKFLKKFNTTKGAMQHSPFQTAMSIKALATTNQFFYHFLNREDVLRSIMASMADSHYEFDDQQIALRLDTMHGMNNSKIQEWINQRAKEIPLENELYYTTKLTGDLEKIKDLIRHGVNVNSYIYGKTALMQLLLCTKEDSEAVKIVLEAGANPNLIAKDPSWQNSTPIFLTIENDNVPLTKRLIAAGADTNSVCRGLTPLLKAAEKGHTGVVELLIDAKANVNKQGKHGYTPLMWAAYSGYCQILQMLLDARAHLDIQDNEGNTALIWAVYNKHCNTTKMLIEAGANAHLASKKYGTALELAQKNGDTRIIDLLQSKANTRT